MSRKRYAKLTKRTADALRINLALEPYIQAIIDAGGKVTKTEPAKGGRTRIVYCSNNGSGDRSILNVTVGEPVPATAIRKELRRNTAYPAATAG